MEIITCLIWYYLDIKETSINYLNMLLLFSLVGEVLDVFSCNPKALVRFHYLPLMEVVVNFRSNCLQFSLYIKGGCAVKNSIFFGFQDY